MRNSGSTGTSTNRQRYRGTTQRTYIDGNTVRKVQTDSTYKRKKANEDSRDRRIKQHRVQTGRAVRVVPMKLGYIAFMVASLCIVCAILIGYVNLQSDVTNRITNISKLESELNQLKMDNDEEYTRIMSEVDLDEIKRIAIQDLGMKYAKEGQIITYSGEGSDYVRQYKEISGK